MRLIIRWLVTAAAVAVTAWLLHGIEVPEGTPGVISVLGFAAILGVVNAVIRPILSFLSCGCLVATLGLFIFVINAVCFWGASWLSDLLGLGFHVDSFLTALLGSIIVSIVSFLINLVLPDEWARGRR